MKLLEHARRQMLDEGETLMTLLMQIICCIILLILLFPLLAEWIFLPAIDLLNAYLGLDTDHPSER